MIESIQRKNSTAKFLLQAATASLDNLNQNVSYQWLLHAQIKMHMLQQQTQTCTSRPTKNSEKATCMRKCVIKYQRMGTLFLFSSSEMR